MWSRWALLGLLVGCKASPTDDLAPTDVADTDTDTDADTDADTDSDTDTDADTHTGPALERPTYIGICGVDVTSANEIPARIVYQDLIGDEAVTLQPGGFILPLPNLAAYALFSFGAGIVDRVDPYAIDFDTEYGVAVTYAPASSCGVELDQIEAFDVDGVTHVNVGLHDASYACETTACTPGPKAIVVLAVPQGTSPKPSDLSGCLGIGGGCGQDLP